MFTTKIGITRLAHAEVFRVSPKREFFLYTF